MFHLCLVQNIENILRYHMFLEAQSKNLLTVKNYKDY